MPLFECGKCQCVENTALAEYWSQQFEAMEKGAPLCPRCSECLTGTWHGKFDKRSAVGMLIDQQGHLWDSEEQIPSHYRIVGKVERRENDNA